MSSDHRRWETLDVLKKLPKGNIKFDLVWSERGEDILAGYEEMLSLSAEAGDILKKLWSESPQKCALLSPGQSSPGLAASSQHGGDATGEDNMVSVAAKQKQIASESKQNVKESSTSLPTVSLRSLEASVIAGKISQYEEAYSQKARRSFRRHQQKMEDMVTRVAKAQLEQMKRYKERMELKRRQEYQHMSDVMERETKDSIGRQEKLKEEQRHRLKILNLRVREAEQQRLREAELERQRQTEGKERLRNLNSIQEEILQLNQLLESSTQNQTTAHPTSVGTYTTRGNQFCSQVSEVVQKMAEVQYPSVEDMTVAERALHEMKALICSMQEEAAKAQEEMKKKVLEEEEESHRKLSLLKTQQEAQKKAELSAKEKTNKHGLQNNAEDTTLKWYKDLQESLDQCAQSIEQLSSSQDDQMRRVKLDLQRASTIPVSQISFNSGSHLQEIFGKLTKLLSGQAVVHGGQSVSTSQHPQGLDFVCYKMAEKFVKQGEAEVAAHHEAAFPIGVVASGIWELHPRVGELVLGHLHKKCPYAVPHYPMMKEGMSVEEYQRILGYRVDDSGVEGQDSFLKSMSGMIRFYAAVIQLRWPFDSKQGSSPHGLNHGWHWLAQMLNMEPIADITATLLLDFLEVCGHALLKTYQGQFWKLILLLKEQYMARIEAVTSSGQMGSVYRLKNFLQRSLQEQQLSPPKGQLGAMFWKS
ncbi:mRNA export factor GLE1-like isoform X2 [Entelurus aequoreus]|uniref:mRNA export factor GLE1-like isoform X2 n=1 Tax=Entelurus aequoreus TaxID=161455 RepID=UPI002B1E21E4|nr:mRNA export factor GLE1-like isoform X2 [Entelurus aequoreus]